MPTNGAHGNFEKVFFAVLMLILKDMANGERNPTFYSVEYNYLVIQMFNKAVQVDLIGL
jgi:hypothetical protein